MIKEAVRTSIHGGDFVRAALSVNNNKVMTFHLWIRMIVIAIVTSFARLLLTFTLNLWLAQRYLKLSSNFLYR